MQDLSLLLEFDATSGVRGLTGFSPFCFQIRTTVLSLTPAARAVVARLP